MWERMERHFRNTGLSNEQLGIVTDNAREKKLDNGTRAICRPLPQDADSFRGKLPKVVVVDEGALVSEEVFSRVIEPMFVTWGYNHELIVMSTPRGKSGYHYRKFTHDDSFESFTAATPDFIPLAVDAGVVDPTAAEWLADKAEEYDENDPVWLTEFMGQFAEVGDPFLPRATVTSCVQQDQPELTGSVFAGVDMALSGDDATVIIAVDSQGHTRVESVVEDDTTPAIISRLERLQKAHSYAGIAVDATGLGEAVTSASTNLTNVEPVKFTSRTKATMYQRLKRLLEGEELSLPNNDRLVNELVSLTYDFTSSGLLQISHSSGSHDDMSDSLCLALEARSTGEQDRYRGATKPVLGTIKKRETRSFETLMKQ
ncbi:hypothetical protein C447_01300 [Halococcus hamelinensis 100A6]|uniref:Terminase large subunit gp17-like C-terminal domain-containing protein n=3 Tax=Halococcus hamelinensis TaxID=332168 RepID=M0M7W0_9EURY|nr:hypothetical protein C447_01300 [Halococcus hamelinensis 100A6]